MYAKIAVTGDARHPLYPNALVESTPETTGDARHPLYNARDESAPETTGDTREVRKHLVEFGVTPTSQPEVLWNFEKFLVGRDGRVVKRFSPDVTPEDAVLRETIEAEMNRAS